MKIVDPQNIHLTLAFLGERALSEIDPIIEAASVAARQRGGAITGLSTDDPLLLPSRRPRVMALSVDDPSGALAALRADLADELGAAIDWHDQRAFRPHLTLARIGREGRPPRQLTPPPRLGFEADEIVLYRSMLEPEGARYSVVESVALG